MNKFTNHEAYNLASEVDSLIQQHLHQKSSPHKEQTYIDSLSKRECYTWLLYLRTIETTITLLRESFQGQIAKIDLEAKQNEK